MKPSRLLLAAILYPLLAVQSVPAFAQCSGMFTSGTICGNNSASGALAGASTVTALFDRVYGSTQNQVIYRGASGWTGLPSANNGVWATNGSGVPAIVTTLPTGLTIPSPLFTGPLSVNGDIVLTHPLTPSPDNDAGTIISLGKGALSSVAPIHSTQYLTAAGFNACASLTTADHITCIGAWSVASYTSGVNAAVTAVGVDTARSLTSGGAVAAFGEHACTSATALTGVTCIGVGTLYFAGNADYNSAFGYNAMASSALTPLTGGSNTAGGAFSLTAIAGIANSNTAYGAESGKVLSTGSGNGIFGFRACQFLTIGNYNLCLGNAGAATLVSGNDNILLGTVNHPADTPTTGTSDYLNIGGTLTGTLGSGGVINFAGGIGITTSALFTNIAPPSTPASGKTIWYTNTSKTPSAKDDGGTVYVMALPATAPANQFLTGLSAVGGFSAAQPTITGIAGLGTNVATVLGTPSSANLAAAITDETGSGALVFGTSPVLTTVDARGVWTTGTSWTLPSHSVAGTISLTSTATAAGPSLGVASSFLILTGGAAGVGFNRHDNSATLFFMDDVTGDVYPQSDGFQLMGRTTNKWLTVNTVNVLATGSILSKGATTGIGYTTGAGGTVTQATSKATAVTLNTVNGTITLNNAALAAATIVTFVVNDSAIAATDYIGAAHESGGTTGAYTINCRATGAGTAACDVRNNTAGSLSEAIVIRFFVLKSVNSFLLKRDLDPAANDNTPAFLENIAA